MTVRGVRPDGLFVEVRDEVLVITGRHEGGPRPQRDGGAGFQRLIGLPPDAGRLGATARRSADQLVVRIPKTVQQETPAVSLEVARSPGLGT